MRTTLGIVAAATAAALTLLLHPTPARAGVVEDLTVAEMAVRADVVVRARVVSVRSGWDEPRARIFTTVRLEVLDYLAGSGPAEVTIRQVGGRVGETELRVAGQPTFVEGRQVVAFLEHAGEGDGFVLLAMGASLFGVEHDRATGEVVLARELAGVARLRPAGAPATSARVVRPLLLRDLAAEVRRARTAGGAR